MLIFLFLSLSLSLSLSLPSPLSFLPPLLHVGPSFIVRLYKTKIFTSRVYQNISRSDTFGELSLPQPVPLCGDIKIEFFHNQRLGGKEKMFHFWFNTFFVDMHVMMQEAQYLEDHRQACSVVTGMCVYVCMSRNDSEPCGRLFFLVLFLSGHNTLH